MAIVGNRKQRKRVTAASGEAGVLTHCPVWEGLEEHEERGVMEKWGEVPEQFCMWQVRPLWGGRAVRKKQRWGCKVGGRARGE